MDICDCYRLGHLSVDLISVRWLNVQSGHHKCIDQYASGAPMGETAMPTWPGIAAEGYRVLNLRGASSSRWPVQLAGDFMYVYTYIYIELVGKGWQPCAEDE